MKSTTIKLPRATNRTVTGPKFEADNERIFVDYDYEHDDGTIEWTRVVFNEILTFEYRRDSVCRADDVISPQQVRCLSESNLLREILDPLRQSSIWLDWQKKKGGVERFKHFTMFFDDVGCLNVVGSSCNIGTALKEASARG
jgi:hypothetical protein